MLIIRHQIPSMWTPDSKSQPVLFLGEDSWGIARFQGMLHILMGRILWQHHPLTAAIKY
jgi:hypothetical protein